MPHVISANRLVDGIVVYMGRDGTWTTKLGEGQIFLSKAEAEAARLAPAGSQRNLVIDPAVVEVTEEAGGPRAVTLREFIRACGPTIDFLPATGAFADEGEPPPENLALRTPRSEVAREGADACLTRGVHSMMRPA